MPDDSVAHAIRLRLGPAQPEDKVARNDRALEFERHVGRSEEFLRGTDIVQQAGESISLHRGRVLIELPLREVGSHERRPIDEDAVTVVECLFVQFFLHQLISLCCHGR